MKDIEQRLDEQKSAEPRRSTNYNFTDQVMERIDQVQHQGRWSQLVSILKGVTHMHALTKPTAAAIIGIGMALSIGTAFAAIQLVTDTAPKVTVSPNAQGVPATIAGNPVVSITLTGCEKGGTDTFLKSQTVHYVIRKDSGLTADKLKDYQQAICESTFPHLLFGNGLTQAQYEAAWGPSGTHAQDFERNVTLDSVEGNTMYVTIKSDFDLQTYHNVPIAIAADAKIYQDRTPITIKDLKPGSSLDIVMHTTSLDVSLGDDYLSNAQKIAMAPQGVPLGSTVTGIMQYVYSFQDQQAGWRSMGKDWSALTPDANSPSGYREITPLK